MEFYDLLKNQSSVIKEYRQLQICTVSQKFTSHRSFLKNFLETVLYKNKNKQRKERPHIQETRAPI